METQPTELLFFEEGLFAVLNNLYEVGSQPVLFLFSVITWLNKQLNEIQMAKKLETSAGAHGAVRTAAISPHGMVRYTQKSRGDDVAVIS